MYGIMRAEKVKLCNVTKKLQQHNQREGTKYNNPDIDDTKTSENVELIHSDNFRESIFEELKKHNITKKPRKGGAT